MQASRRRRYELAALAVFEVFEQLLKLGFPRLAKERGHRTDHADSKPEAARVSLVGANRRHYNVHRFAQDSLELSIGVLTRCKAKLLSSNVHERRQVRAT